MQAIIRVALFALPLSLAACSQSGARPPGPHGAPPAEATAACASLAEGASCSVKMNDKTMEGTCKKGPEADAALACMPNDAPPPGHGGPGAPPPPAASAQ